MRRLTRSRLALGMVLVLTMVLTMAVTSFAADAPTAADEPAADVAAAASDSKTLELSLVDAIKLAIANSSDIAMAKLNERLAEISLTEFKAAGADYISQDALTKAEQSYADAQQATIDTYKSVALNVENGYYALLKAYDSVVSAQRSVESNEKQLQVVKAKFDAGLESKSNLDAAQKKLESARKALESAQFSLETEKMRFNSTLGVDLSTQVTLTEKFEYQPVDVDLTESIEFALAHRTDIAQKVKAVEDARTALTNAKEYNNTTRLALEKLEIALKKAEMSLASTMISAQITVRAQYSSFLAKADAVVAKQDAVAAATLALDKARAKFDVGLATLNDVNDAEAALLDAETALSQSVYDFNVAKASFYQAIGKDYISIDQLMGEKSDSSAE